MTDYVAGLMFSKDRRRVAMIMKMKPAWQAGKLNAIGGKIEPGEAPLDAMVREFWEEAGVRWPWWQPVAVLDHNGHMVHFFAAFTDAVEQVITAEKEVVRAYALTTLDFLPLMKNLRTIIALATDESGIEKPVHLFDKTPVAA